MSLVVLGMMVMVVVGLGNSSTDGGMKLVVVMVMLGRSGADWWA